MKSLLFSLLISVAFCASKSIKIKSYAHTNSQSCDYNQGLFYFWIPISRTGFDEDSKFQLPFAQPNNYANTQFVLTQKHQNIVLL